MSVHCFGALNGKGLTHANRIWNYFKSFHSLGAADAIVVCCSYDLRIGNYACELLKQGYAGQLVFSGRNGLWTRQLWRQSEASVFHERAIANNADKEKILIEDQAGNIGENIRLSRRLLPDAKKVLFVTKPNTLLRVKLSVPVQWPDIDFYTAAPDFSFPSDVSQIVGILGVIHEMVGDVERIRQYPALGYQVEHLLPEEIIQSWRYLKFAGFTHHSLPDI